MIYVNELMLFLSFFTRVLTFVYQVFLNLLSGLSFSSPPIYLVIFICSFSFLKLMMQGLPGSYSEDAALKAYPNCESVPCNEFEDAFKVCIISAKI